MMNSLTVKILAALVSVLMLTTICSQIYYLVHDKHDVEEAVLATVNEDIVFKGIVIRDEQVVTYTGSGVLDYKYSDGSKVSVNSTLAEVFSSEDAILARDKIAAIDEEIDRLSRAQSPGTANYVEPEALLGDIGTSYDELLECIGNRDFGEISEVRKDLETDTDLYEIVTGIETDYNERIDELTAERNRIKANASAPVDVIKASKTGYFVSYADGYESVLSTDMTDELTEELIDEVLKGNAAPPAHAIGKTFDSYTCKIAGVVRKDDRISEGNDVSLMLNSSRNVYTCEVESVKPCGEDNEKMLVVLSCDILDAPLVESRQLSAKLIFEEYQGIKVPRSAIRFRDNEKGVYVILGKDISFKKINVIYEGSDYVLSENTSDEEYLLLYDQILLEVVSSKDVSDTKQKGRGGS